MSNCHIVGNHMSRLNYDLQGLRRLWQGKAGGKPAELQRQARMLKLRVSSNSYTMACPPVRGDNPRALASGLSYVQVDKQ